MSGECGVSGVVEEDSEVSRAAQSEQVLSQPRRSARRSLSNVSGDGGINEGSSEAGEDGDRDGAASQGSLGEYPGGRV